MDMYSLIDTTTKCFLVSIGFGIVVDIALYAICKAFSLLHIN